jgi:hypothetical protein
LTYDRFKVLATDNVLNNKLLDNGMRGTIELCEKAQAKGLVERAGYCAARVGSGHGQSSAKRAQTVMRLAARSVCQTSQGFSTNIHVKSHNAINLK